MLRLRSPWSHSRARRRGQVLFIAVLLMILAAMLGSTFAVLLTTHSDPTRSSVPVTQKA